MWTLIMVLGTCSVLKCALDGKKKENWFPTDKENAFSARMAYFSSTLLLLIANGFSSETTSSREIPSRGSSVGPMPNMIVLQSLIKINTETSSIRVSIQKTKKLTLFFCWRRAAFHWETQKTANTWLWQVNSVLTNHIKVQDMRAKLKTRDLLPLLFVV